MSGINAIGCFRIGKHDVLKQNPPTVYISVSQWSGRGWKGAREKVVTILNRFGLQSVAVAIMKDEIVRGHNDFHEERLPETARYTTQVGMSIGVHGSRSSSSTFGGIVEIRHPKTGKWEPQGLTCFHCVDPTLATDIKPPSCKCVGYRSQLANLSDNTRAGIDDWKKNGIRPDDKNAEKMLLVDMPSLKDIGSEIDRLGDDINAMKNDEFREVERTLQAGEFVMPHDGKMYERRKGLINESLVRQTDLESLRSKNKLGFVFAASGYKERPATSVSMTADTLFDWALIKVDKHRLGENTVRGIPTAYHYLSIKIADVNKYRSICLGHSQPSIDSTALLS